MGVYVKGMTFPKSCSVCDFKSVMGYCRRMPPEFYGCTRDEGRPDWCPLVEVREPHGRLIDADDFFERLMEKDRTFSLFFDGMFVDIFDMNELLSDLKTVIEAEGAEEVKQ